MNDTKLRCALVYRLETNRTVCLAKYDHANQYESHGDDDTFYGKRGESYADAVVKIIDREPPSGLADPETIGGFKTVQSDQHLLVYGADKDGICAAVITGRSYPARVAIQMLQELHKECINRPGEVTKTAAENSLSKKAKNTLKDICQKYEELEQVDKISSLSGQVNKVKNDMHVNITNISKNIDSAEDLVEKSNELVEQASVFKIRAKKLERQMAWKNLKVTVILGGLAAVILIAILVPLFK